MVAPLAEAEERDGWSGFAFVSEWQQERYIEQFHIPREKARVLRNAISPAFAETPLAPAWFEREEPPDALPGEPLIINDQYFEAPHLHCLHWFPCASGKAR